MSRAAAGLVVFLECLATSDYLLDLVDFERCENIILIAVNDNALNTFKNEWSAKVNGIQARSGRGGNKLRTYRKFKSEYGVEPYVLCVRVRGHRFALARLRARVAPINHWVPSRGRSESAALGVCVYIQTHTLRVLPIHFDRETVPSAINIEIGRCTSTPIKYCECPFCPGKVEDEEHVIMSCPKYSIVREGHFNHATYCHLEFFSLIWIDNFIILMSSKNIANRCAEACSEILDIISTILNSSEYSYCILCIS